MKPKKKPLSGGARLIESGRSPILLGVTPEEKELLQRAAASERRRMTQFLLYHGLAAAEKILRKLEPAPNGK